MVTIKEVLKSSLADRAGITTDYALVSINGIMINDVLDYRFYMTDRKLVLELLDMRDEATTKTVEIKKGEYEDLGLEFETYLMDKQRFCKNKCIFCFVDQTPKGMRESLYFKDDDARMSFLFGNYISLTNLEENDIDRIIKMHISPVNISVHTMNPELRVKMMANPRSGEVLSYIKRLCDGGIKVNTQLVLCPQINDGEELKRSLDELGEMYPSLQSIACVPVGLTDHRKGLYEILPYTKKGANQVIDIIDDFSDRMLKLHGERVAYPADEFFLKAGREIPACEYYGEFAQLDNGVGLMALLLDEFEDALRIKTSELDKKRIVSIATGEAAYELMKTLAKKAEAVYPNLEVKVHKIINDYFGHNITVAGLVTGSDLKIQLKGEYLGEELLIPDVMLRHEKDLFLDDVSKISLEKFLGLPVKAIPVDGFKLLGGMLGKDDLYE